MAQITLKGHFALARDLANFAICLACVVSAPGTATTGIATLDSVSIKPFPTVYVALRITTMTASRGTAIARLDTVATQQHIAVQGIATMGPVRQVAHARMGLAGQISQET